MAASQRLQLLLTRHGDHRGVGRAGKLRQPAHSSGEVEVCIQIGGQAEYVHSYDAIKVQPACRGGVCDDQPAVSAGSKERIQIRAPCAHVCFRRGLSGRSLALSATSAAASVERAACVRPQGVAEDDALETGRLQLARHAVHPAQTRIQARNEDEAGARRRGLAHLRRIAVNLSHICLSLLLCCLLAGLRGVRNAIPSRMLWCMHFSMQFDQQLCSRFCRQVNDGLHAVINCGGHCGPTLQPDVGVGVAVVVAAGAAVVVAVAVACGVQLLSRALAALHHDARRPGVGGGDEGQRQLGRPKLRRHLSTR
eukprot:6201791-Pleurochrysis_carterae.AAC.2